MRTKVALYSRSTLTFIGLCIMVGVVIGAPHRAAAEGCGTITSLSGEETTITDCENPFAATITTPGSYLRIDGANIYTGDTATATDVAGYVQVVPDYYNSMRFTTLYRQTAAGYEEVYDETISPEYPSEDDVKAALRVAFPAYDESTITAYYEALEADGYDALTIVQQDEVDDFYSNGDFYAHVYDPLLPSLPPGTYVAVFSSFVPCYVSLNSATWWERVRAFFIPTVYAQFLSCAGNHSAPIPVEAVTFTVAVDTPAGVSSVLFLPGIQASRLYTDSEKVWEPGNNGDVRALAMTDAGESLEAIHTKDVIDEIYGVFNVYKDFFAMLDQMKTSEHTIFDWSAFPYDWRYDIFDVVDHGTAYDDGIHYVQDELTRLAATSYSGKVTIIAHSNGGLLAKALLIEHPELASKVDKIIFIGTPHLGTPKAIGTILHGYDQQALRGWLIDDAVARDVIKNLPGAYALLPSLAYQEQDNTPLITFDESTTTIDFRSYYGESVDTPSEFSDFMLGADGRTLVDHLVTDPARYPSVANGSMFLAAQTEHTQTLDNWQAPSGVTVIDIVGTGVPTLKSVQYRTVSEDYDGVTLSLLKPWAILSRYGDATVMSQSAAAVDYDWKYYVDLEALKLSSHLPKFLQKKVDHSNLTELDPTQSIIKQTLVGSSTDNIAFVSTTEPDFGDAYSIEAVDSPIALYLTDSVGNRTGLVPDGNGGLVVVEEIPGSQYIEFGDTKYVVVPAGTNTTSTLVGLSAGGYTLTIATLGSDNTQRTATQLINQPVTAGTVAVYEKSDGEYSTMRVDSDGDGVYDEELSLDGGLLSSTASSTESVTDEPAVTGTYISSGGSSRPASKVLGAAIVLPDLSLLSRDELVLLLIQVLERLIALKSGNV